MNEDSASIDMGTYNFYPSTDWENYFEIIGAYGGHFFNDMLPYYGYGNSREELNKYLGVEYNDEKIVKKVNSILFVFQAYKISWIPVVLLCGIFSKGIKILETVVEFIYYPWFILLAEASKNDFVSEHILMFGLLYILPSIVLFLELLITAFWGKYYFTKKEERMILFFSIVGFLTEISHILMLLAAWF